MKTKFHQARRQIVCWAQRLCLCILSFMSIESVAQSTATFGAPGIPGTVNATCGPIARVSATSSEDFSQHYYLYTAADMASAGIIPGSTITAIQWYKANNGATTPGNLVSSWKVHMKNSATMPSPTWCNPSYNVQSIGATLVYSNTAQVIPNTIGWITLPLSTPFVYTGGSLEIGSNWSCNLFTGNPTTSGIAWNLHNIPPPNQTFGRRGTSGSLVMINESCSPISQLVFTSPTPTCAAPNPGLTFSTDTTACYGSNFTLSLQNSTPGTGVTYSWECADDIDFLINVNSLGTSPTQIVTATTPKYYHCQVTCSNGPITGFSAPIFVNVYDPLSVHLAAINITCNGSNDGELYSTVSGGTSPYNYSYNGGVNDPPSLSSLPAGSYNLTVTDLNGCSASDVDVITEPTILNLSSIVTNASGPGMANGGIILNAVGGTPPYMFSIDGGITYLPNNLFNGLLPSLYHCRVQDEQGCTTALDVTVNFASSILVDPNIFFEVSDDKDTIAHIVWGMPLATSFSVFSVQVEGSDDGVNFYPIQQSPVSILPNAMTMPIGSIAPLNTLMFSNELQPRFIYNEIVPNLSPSTTKYYRARLSNQTGTQVIYTVIKQFLPPPVLYPAWPILNPMPCPPIGIPPTGFVPTPWLSTNQVGCCIVTKRLYMKFGCAVPQPCTDCVPACNCTTDPCCFHNCAQYLFCSCTPWVSCGVAVQAQWIVIATTALPIAVTATKTNVSCNGGSNGTITVSGPVQWCKRYKIIGAPACFTAINPLPFPNAIGQVSNVFTGLCAGCYTIMVKDCYGCTGTTVVCITQPTAINLNATAVNTCTCTGSITVNATGGTPCPPLTGAYTYQMLPLGVPQTSNVFNNLCVGCYTIKVTDCNGCTKTIVKCVTNTTFNLYPIKVEPCLGSNNGSICISSSPLIGTSNNACLKYHIGTSCTTPAGSIFTTNPCFYNLVAGTYCIKIVDTCTGCDTCICVTLTNSTTPCGSTNNLVVNTGYDPITGTKIIPNGVVDPLWTVTPTGGGAFGPVLTNAHPVWAVNANSHAIGWSGSTATGFRIFRRTFKMCSCDSITFNLNLAYDNWLNGIYIDGMLVTIPNTITPFVQWGWTSNFTMFHNYTFTKYLCAGTHTIDVKVVNLGGPMGLNLFGSLTGTNNSLVTNLSPVNCCCACVPPQVSPTVTNVSCNGGSNGLICINSLTPVPNPCLKYALVTSNCTLPTGSVYQNNPCFGGLSAGAYCIKIVDTCTGCDTCICVSISQPPPIILTATSIGTCSCTGSVSVTATGGVPCTGVNAYTYQILPAGVPQNSNTFNNLCVGCYTIMVTDCNGCTATIVKCVTASGTLGGMSLVKTNVSCFGGSDGSICATNTTGNINPCLKYKIGASCTSIVGTGTTNPCFNNLPAGSYCVKITDTCSGCDTCICVNITQPNPITLTATSIGTCSCTGSITVNAVGGVLTATCPFYTYQILPAGVPQNSNTFNNLCVGCYTIMVTDCNGCTATIVKCVTASGTLGGMSLVKTNVSCFGGSDGSICATNTTGNINPCLKYKIGASCTSIVGTGTTNPCFNNLPAGSYCVKITDTCSGCDTCICVNITQPNPITLTATSVGTCSCTGSITVNAVGGVLTATCPFYTYQILPAGVPQNSNTFNNLCVGCYTIMVTDCNGCTATIVKCVTASGTLGGMSLVKTNVSCFGGSDGSICATNTTGIINPCLKYKIGATCTSIFGTGTTNPCFNNLPAGSYCVKITDTCSGCDTCICVNITQPNPITLTATSVGTCSCTGSITVNAVGGVLTATCPFYTYQILPAGVPQTSNTFNNLCVGCYTIMVTDCNGCTATIVKCVIASGTLGGMSLVKTNVSCFGGSDGSICATNTTGNINPCLKYKIGASCTSIVGTGTTNPCFNNLPAGSYCVKITDTCSGCDTCICVNITQPSPITLTATSVGTCSCTGSITVNAVGGTPCTFFPMYTYQIFPSGIVQASPTFNNLCVGCYTIVVTDCNGCTATIVKCVTASGTLGGMNLVKTNVSCFGGSDGSICAISPVPTNPCLKYKIGATCTSIVGTGTTNPCFNNLPAGSYCVKITDTCSGCDTCICVNISQPNPIILTATSVGTCSCTGSITVNAVGGIITATCPYTYQILPAGVPQNSNTFNNLCVGCYTIMVTDCNGCTATIVKCVTASGTLGGMNLVKTNVSCFGGSDGSICATNAVGAINPCLKYNIGATCTSIFGTGTTNPCFNNLPAGSYCVKITDTCSGCDTCICVNISQPNPIILTATSVGTCSCTGSITVNAVGGIITATCPYTYQILPAGVPQNSNTFNNLCVGCYTIMVTDCNGCTATIVKCVTASGTLGGMNLVKTNVSCFGGSDGSICATNTTGIVNPCLKYKIGATCTSIFGTGTTNPCFNNLPAGSYCVKITDTCSGCDTCICVNITQPSPITLTATSVTACPCNSSITVNAIGGSPCATGYTYQLLPGGLPQPNNTFIGLCAGCYTIVVTDCNGCTSSIVKCVGPCGANPIVVNLQLFLQGYYIGSQLMTPVLMNQGVSSSNTDVDSIEVELRNPLPPYNVITSTTAMLHVDGSASCSFFTSVQGPYQLAVKHRNSIQTWSSLPINATSSAPTFYNFTNAANKAFGNNMDEVEPGVWAFYTGDINQDENVDLSDYSAYELDVVNFTSGYFPTDINGDGNVDILDAPKLESNIMNFIYSIHP